MRVLLTGGSSFTGFWFARELAGAGHEIVAVFRGAQDGYAGVRCERVKAVAKIAEPLWGVEFGDQRFLEAVGTERFDLFLHHAAEMANYRSWDFDALAATAKNTRSIRPSLELLAERDCRRLILTGSVFEPYEGVGDADRRAFNPYGLSKHLTFELFRIEAERMGLSLGKFVIPNPFGPREEMRFTSYLAKEWAAGRTPIVATPVYVRDNIPVSLLSLAYRRFCECLPYRAGLARAAPSGYIESQGAFARRVAREIGARTGWTCALEEGRQKDFCEPLVRVNFELAAHAHSEWDESGAWDELADYYLRTFI